MLVGKFCEDRAVVGKCRTARASGVKTSFAPPPLAPALQPTWLDQPGAARWSYRQATAGVRTIRRQSAVRSVTRPAENGFPQSAVRSVTLRAGRPFCCVQLKHCNSACRTSLLLRSCCLYRAEFWGCCCLPTHIIMAARHVLNWASAAQDENRRLGGACSGLRTGEHTHMGHVNLCLNPRASPGTKSSAPSSLSS